MAIDLYLPHANRPVPVSIHTRGITTTRSYRAAVSRMLATAVGRFTRRIRAIHIWLEDINGPRGGVDIRCRIELHLRPRGRITVSALAADEYVATARAAFRSGRLVKRRVEKARARRRRLAQTASLAN